MARTHIYNRIKTGIEDQNKRRSRRYSVFLPVSFHHLARDIKITGNIVDLSLHGAIITSEADIIFKVGDQLKLSIPVGEHLERSHGDFIKISAKARVFTYPELKSLSPSNTSPKTNKNR